MNQPNTIIFIGPQGSGKGTQAQILARKIGAEYIEMGAILRNIAQEDNDFGRAVKETLNSGNLVDDPTWYRAIKNKLLSLPAGMPAIFDGSPRTIDQAHLLIDYLRTAGRDKIATLYITLGRDDSIKRLMLRRICANCKTPAVSDGSENQVCAKCGGPLISRADDTVEGITQRLKRYEEDTVPVIEFLKENTELHQVDGTPDIAEVTKEIDKALGI